MVRYEKINGNFGLTGKTAIVVGGASGIEETTTQMYARKGAGVAIVSCKDSHPEVAAKIAEGLGVQATDIKCDVTSQESVDVMMKTVLEASGEISTLAATSGFVDLYRAPNISIATIERHMSISTVGVFRVCRAVTDQVIKQDKDGKMARATSQADFIAINKHVSYTVSKAAMVGMAKVCALEQADCGINVGGVTPTVVNTYMSERAW